MIRRFARKDEGTTAVLFGFAIIPLLAASGVAVDYSRAGSARTHLQSVADAASLQLAVSAYTGASADGQTVTRSRIEGGRSLAITSVNPSWDAGTSRYTVKIAATLPNTLFGMFRKDTPVQVTAVAAVRQNKQKLTIEGANLSPEAGDYNEMSAYCFKLLTGERLGPLDEKTNKRTPFLKIADNSDEGVKTKPTNLEIICGAGENISYQLKNVRNARANPALRASGETWNHFTDTTIPTSGPQAGVPIYNTLYKNLVESIICDSKEQCRPKSAGGILPENEKERAPKAAGTACAPGKFIYLGWEDRPPGIGQWTDRDYDDIRLVMSCPGVINGPITVRLVD